MSRIKFLGFAILLVVMLCFMSACKCEHEVIVDPAITETCTESGLTEGSHCNLCGEILTAQETIPANGHTEAIIERTEATCTESGLTEGKQCSVCGEMLTAQETIPANGHTETILPKKEATCSHSGLTEGKQCSVCKTTLVKRETIPAKGHTTTTGTCANCGADFGLWEINYYVDEFQRPTDKAYISNKTRFTGTFSNSATTNSRLSIRIAAEKDYIAILLYEYGSNLVKNSSSKYVDEYDVTIRTPDGKKTTFSGGINPGGNRIVFSVKDMKSVLNILKSNQEIDFYIVESDRPTTSYLFTVEQSNFAELYNKLG